MTKCDASQIKAILMLIADIMARNTGLLAESEVTKITYIGIQIVCMWFASYYAFRATYFYFREKEEK